MCRKSHDERDDSYHKENSRDNKSNRGDERHLCHAPILSHHTPGLRFAGTPVT